MSRRMLRYAWLLGFAAWVATLVLDLLDILNPPNLLLVTFSGLLLLTSGVLLLPRRQRESGS